MIRITLADRDLVGLRLTYAPYWDVVCAALGVAAEGESDRPARAGSLVGLVRRLLGAPSLRFFSDGVVPSFLSPVPEPGESLEASLARIDAVHPTDIERALLQYVTLFPRRREAILRAWANPVAELAGIRRAFREVWQSGFGATWPTLEAVHQGDLSRRSLLLASDGPLQVLDDLRPGVWVEGHELCLPNRCEWTYAPTGAGITLISSVFAPDGCLGAETNGGRWLVVYPPTGRSLALVSEPKTTSAEMTELIGPVRAQIVAALQVPKTTIEIARLCRLAPNTASYHLGRLREAGMVVARRSGNHSYYQLARRGTDFLALWDSARSAPEASVRG